MSSYVGVELRRLIAERAGFLCEYCLVAESDTFFGCEVDHIISEKHGGATEAVNLAYASAFCNRHKGSDVGSIDWQSRHFSRFYNPREDRWSEHFLLDGIEIQPRTMIGRVTVRILKMNVDERLLERRVLQAQERYPSEAALNFIEASRS